MTIRSNNALAADCPVQRTLDLIRSKWMVQLIRLLHQQPRGFAELEREMQGITPKILSARLRQLTDEGMVDRLEGGGRTGAVTYQLTALGQDLVGMFFTMSHWDARRMAVRRDQPSSGLVSMKT